jgi:hypothetical protein
MHTLRLSKHSVGAAYLLASVLFVIGVWVVWHTSGKSTIDTIPLCWLFAIVGAPLVSFACVVAMWLQRASAWLVGSATLLLLPQCFVCYYAAKVVLHYLLDW